jgi:Secretion system C-terminal sorting domain
MISMHFSKLPNMFGRALCSITERTFIIASCLMHLDAQQTLPLSVGNAWHYNITYFTQYPTPTESFTVRVIGDSLKPNGKRYWILDPSDMFGKYVRSDSTSIYYWQRHPSDTVWSEEKIFDIRDTIGTVDTINFANYKFATAGNSYRDTLFSKSTLVKGYGLGGLIFGYIGIAEGFGYMRYEYDADLGDTYDIWELTGCIIANTLYGRMTGVPSLVEPPERIKLLQNHPNPFNPSTTIQFSIAERSWVRLTIFNILGQQVAEMANEEMAAGNFEKTWSANVASGLYIYRLESVSVNDATKRFVDVKKMILIK